MCHSDGSRALLTRCWCSIKGEGNCIQQCFLSTSARVGGSVATADGITGCLTYDRIRIGMRVPFASALLCI